MTLTPLDRPPYEGGTDPTASAGVADQIAVGRAVPLIAPGRWRWQRLWRGRPEDPAWVHPALAGLLAATALLYLWDLGASGWANAFYSAAVQAGTRSWKAFFFGSFDSSNFITVDKPPASLWIMEISARMFGVNAWSILVPQALEGVATVGVLYAAVRRWFSPAAALLAGAVLALTPVAAVMFRFNNPDALLVLLLTAAAYATVRALEKAQTRWLVLAGSLVGFGFITKMLQAFLVIPAIGLAYLVAAPTPFRRRILQGLVAGVALVVSAGWWVAAVMLTPAADRPYVGGSQDNSLFNLIFGYNGFGRLTGNETGSVGGAGAPGGIWGPTGWTRLFQSSMGGQISWLIPAAIVGLIAVLWLTRRAPRTNRARAAALLWGGYLVVTGAVLSFSKGIIHPYYTVALAPAVGALVGIGAVGLWRARRTWFARWALGLATAATAVWSFVLLDRSAQWLPPLRYLVLVAGLAAAAGFVLPAFVHRGGRLAVLTLALAVALGGPLAYTIDTVLTPHAGAIPSAGPTLAASSGPGAGGFPGRGAPAGQLPRSSVTGPPGGPTGGRPGPFGGQPPKGSPRSVPGGPGRGQAAGPGGPRATGGLLNAGNPSPALVRLLEHDAGRYKWVAATVGANSAAGFQLATDDPVMAIGGFNGTDPAPTLAEFEKYVANGDIHYFIASGGGAGGFGGPGAGPLRGGQGAGAGVARRGPAVSGATSQITTWVERHFHAQTVDGVTLYDLG